MRLQLQSALLGLLANRIWDGLRSQVLDILWGLGSCEWEQFVQNVLPGFCRACSDAVQVRSAEIMNPFAEGSGSLNDFAHFASCMDAFINDVRFFGSLSAWT